MRYLVSVLAASAFAGAAVAQQSIVAPIGFANAEGNSNNAFPWNWSSSAIRTQFIYDSSNFTQQGVVGPVLINRLRFRADGVTGNWTGGTYGNAVIQLSTCPVDYLAVSGVWGANHGPDLLTVLSGPVVVQPGSSTSPGPGPWYIDIPFTAPFLYDPTSGSDLTVDIQVPAFSGSYQADHNTGAGVTRVYDTTGIASSGTVGTNYGAICEFSFVPSSGYASAFPYGSGCPSPSSAVVYESFLNYQAFDLANSSLLFIPGGNGSYVILPGVNTWFTGFTNNLALADDQCGTVTMPFAFPHAGGSTSTISVCSNGFLWLGTNTDADYTATNTEFLSNPMARIAACWMDLYPPGGGGVFADFDPSTGEYVVTWNNVPEFTTNPPVTMQIALQANGIFEIRYQTLTNSAHPALTGYSAGAAVADPGSVDLSSVATTPITSGIAAMPLALGASARPVLGTSINLTTDRIPAGTPVGALLLSLAQINPGIDLTPLGATNCRQYVGSSVSLVFVPAATSVAQPLSVPNNPALAGLHVFGQTLSLTAGYNALGVIFSNGLDLLLDAQ